MRLREGGMRAGSRSGQALSPDDREPTPGLVEALAGAPRHQQAMVLGADGGARARSLTSLGATAGNAAVQRLVASVQRDDNDDDPDALGSFSGAGFYKGEDSKAFGQGTVDLDEGTASGSGKYENSGGTKVVGQGAVDLGEGTASGGGVYRGAEGSKVVGAGSVNAEEGTATGVGSYENLEGSKVKGGGSVDLGEGSASGAATYRGADGTQVKGGGSVNAEQGTASLGGSYQTDDGTRIAGTGSVGPEGITLSGELPGLGSGSVTLPDPVSAVTGLFDD